MLYKTPVNGLKVSLDSSCGTLSQCFQLFQIDVFVTVIPSIPLAFQPSFSHVCTLFRCSWMAIAYSNVYEICKGRTCQEYFSILNCVHFDKIGGKAAHPSGDFTPKPLVSMHRKKKDAYVMELVMYISVIRAHLYDSACCTACPGRSWQPTDMNTTTANKVLLIFYAFSIVPTNSKIRRLKVNLSYPTGTFIGHFAHLVTKVLRMMFQQAWVLSVSTSIVQWIWYHEIEADFCIFLLLSRIFQWLTRKTSLYLVFLLLRVLREPIMMGITSSPLWMNC